MIQILKGEALFLKRRWGVDKILATLVQHREDPRLHTPYRQFKRFAYQVFLEESDESGRWPSILGQKDWDLIIKLRAQRELEKRYNKEIQQLCKTPCFGAADKKTPGVVNKSPFDDIVEVATEKAPLITSMVVSVGPRSAQYSTNTHLISMKLIAILVIFCQSAHWNNSNYLPLLIALYFYFSGARVDAITFLNHFGLSVSYNVLQIKLHSITSSSKK